MRVIGLTGSIGMGKSLTASLLRRLGIPVHDSDRAVHDLLSPRGAGFRPVAQAFPEAWDRRTRTIDRRRLGEIVFKDPEKKRLLEAILHPLVRQSQQKFVLRCRRMGSRLAVLDIPLLYETGAESRCDSVICVSAPYMIQRLRVLRRPNMTEEKFLAILAAQMPDREKRRRADVVVPTGLGRAHTLLRLKNYMNQHYKKKRVSRS